MTVVEKLAKVDAELEALSAEYKKLGEKIQRKRKVQEKLLLELNHDNLKDPAWLFRNPTMPGVYEATQKLIKDQYGEYTGPHPQGYIHDGNYKPIQANFNFWLKNYGSKTREVYKKNCEHFLENYLHIFDPVMEISGRYGQKFPEMKVVPFQFESEEHGLNYLGYNPEDKKWYHFTMRYGITDIVQVFKDWDAAFNYAYDYSNNETDDNEIY